VAKGIDPTCGAAQMVAGSAYLGAGVIIKSGRMVRDLTTAAFLCMVGAIGMAVGSGLCAPAVVAAIMALFNLVFLMLIERSILP
jgi:putative Mg2+ transporter-C (MgtC) family protein